MKLMIQIATVFGICLLGSVIVSLLPFPFPSSVMSMLILFVLLAVKAVRPEHIEGFSDFLLKNMAFFFIPAGVELMDHYSVISRNIVAFITICAVSSIVTFAAAGYTVRLVIMLQNKFAGGGRIG